MGCLSEAATLKTNPPINLVLLLFVDPFGLDQQQSVIEKKDHKIGIFALGTTAALEWTFVDQLSIFVFQPEVLRGQSLSCHVKNLQCSLLDGTPVADQVVQG